MPDSNAGRDGHRSPGQRETPSSDDLWDAFEGMRGTGESGAAPEASGHSTRDDLVIHYAPLVRYVAARVRTGLPGHIDVADLVSAGFVGLIRAIESYDRDRGISFDSYAVPRIRGAMLDEMRAFDWAPRSLRRRARDIDSAITDISVRSGRAPTDVEIAERLGMTPVDLHDTLNQIAFADVLALTGRDEARESGAPDPLETVEQWGMHQEVINAVHRLPVRERIVVALYYWEGFTLAQVAQVLDISESRASQLHASAVQRLRPWMLVQAS